MLEGGPACDDGTVLAPSTTYGASIEDSITIPNGRLVEGANTIRVCFVSSSSGGTATRTAVVNKYSVAPETVLASMPPSSSNSSTGTFAFSSPQTGATFERSLDGALFGACTSGISYPDLSDETHVFLVRAINPAALTDPIPAAWVWTIDTVAPDTGLVTPPAGTLTQRDVTVALTASEPGAGFECKLNAGPYQTCTPPTTYVALADGAYTLLVRAVDAAGNVDLSPARADWSVVSLAQTPAALAANVRKARVKPGDHRAILNW
jgi:hypothetical protein